MKKSAAFTILFAIVVLLTVPLFASTSGAGTYHITMPNTHDDPAIVVKDNPNNKLKITKIRPAEKATLKPGEKVIVSFEYSADKTIQPLTFVRAFNNGKPVKFKTKDMIVPVGPSGKCSQIIQIDSPGVSVDEICMTMLSQDGKRTLRHFHRKVDLKWDYPPAEKYAKQYLGTWAYTIKIKGKPTDFILRVELDKNSKLTFSYIAGFDQAPVLQQCSVDPYRAEAVFKTHDDIKIKLLVARRKNTLDATFYAPGLDEQKYILKRATVDQLAKALESQVCKSAAITDKNNTLKKAKEELDEKIKHLKKASLKEVEEIKKMHLDNNAALKKSYKRELDALKNQHQKEFKSGLNNSRPVIAELREKLAASEEIIKQTKAVREKMAQRYNEINNAYKKVREACRKRDQQITQRCKELEKAYKELQKSYTKEREAFLEEHNHLTETFILKMKAISEKIAELQKVIQKKEGKIDGLQKENAKYLDQIKKLQKQLANEAVLRKNREGMLENCTEVIEKLDKDRKAILKRHSQMAQEFSSKIKAMSENIVHLKKTVQAKDKAIAKLKNENIILKTLLKQGKNKDKSDKQ